ncbi:MAG: pyridoxal phosphate-dependent aminotransferase [Prevotellaceae bacterium]|jgi:aspartate aminotransferase|nr:pyridoxal phosphate-dependent aminotransferase [Prevotellaceae bacterium]
MEQVSRRISELSTSETLAMSARSAELRARGIDVINLSVGEPDFYTPEHIKRAAEQAIDNNYSFYSPVAGFLELRQAICEKLKRENQLDFSPAQIVVSNGAKQSVCNVLMSVVGSNDEVIIPSPFWVSYPEMVKLAEATPVFVPANIESDFKISPAQLEAAITPKTRAIILCSPSNPTGSVYSQSELAALARVLENHPNIIIISDEIYEHINYTGEHQSIAQFEKLRARTVIINGVSKGYAMTGWRIGWLAAPKWIADACNKLQGQFTSGACSIAQKAAQAAYEGDQTCVREMQQAFERRRDLVVNLANKIDGLKVNRPQGAFYIFPECKFFFGKSLNGRKINNASDLAMYLLDEANVACVAGDAFGAAECIRMSYATSDDKLTEAFARIKTALGKLK